MYNPANTKSTAIGISIATFAYALSISNPTPYINIPIDTEIVKTGSNSFHCSRIDRDITLEVKNIPTKTLKSKLTAIPAHIAFIPNGMVNSNTATELIFFKTSDFKT